MIKKKYIKHKEFLNNFFWRGLQIFSKQGITLLTFFICAKLLTEYEFGIYNYLIAMIYFFIIFGDFGISSSVSKSIAECRRNEKDKIEKIIFNSFFIISIITLLCLLISIVLVKSTFNEYSKYIYYIIPLIFLIPANSLLDGIYRGIEKFKILSIKTSAIGLISIGLIFVLTKQFGLIGALLSLVLFNFLLFIILIIGIKKPKFHYNKKIIKEITSYSLIIGLGSIGLYLYTKIDLLFLGYFGFISEISYYEIINKLQIIFLTPFLIIAQVIAPKITRLYANKEKKKVFFYLKKIILFCFISGLIICSLIFLFKEPFFEIFFAEYATNKMYSMLNLMLIVYFTQTLTSIIPIGFAISTGHAKISMNILLFFGILNVILNYFFITNFGFMGIIYSTIICKLSADFLFLLLYFRKIKN